MPQGYGAAIASLLVTALVVMGSPGPSTLSLVAASVAHGARGALTYGLGLVVGTATVLLAVATGITTVLLAVPSLRTVLLLAAAAYLIWLAYRLATASPLADRSAQTSPPSFAGGIALGALNPKAWVAIGVGLRRVACRCQPPGRRLRQGARADRSDRRRPRRLARGRT